MEKKQLRNSDSSKLQWINPRCFSSICCTHNAGNSIFALWNTKSFTRPFCDIWFLFFHGLRLEFALGMLGIVGAAWNIFHFVLIVQKALFTWGCVCSARSWKKTEKRDKGISGKKREQLLAEKHSLTPDLELNNAERGRKEMKNLQSKWFGASPAPKFPALGGKQPQTELSAPKKIKILASLFPFSFMGWVVLHNKWGWKDFWDPHSQQNESWF